MVIYVASQTKKRNNSRKIHVSFTVIHVAPQAKNKIPIRVKKNTPVSVEN